MHRGVYRGVFVWVCACGGVWVCVFWLSNCPPSSIPSTITIINILDKNYKTNIPRFLPSIIIIITLMIIWSWHLIFTMILPFFKNDFELHLGFYGWQQNINQHIGLLVSNNQEHILQWIQILIYCILFLVSGCYIQFTVILPIVAVILDAILEFKHCNKIQSRGISY